MVIFISLGRFAVTFVTPVSTSMKLLSAISLPSDPCWDRGQPLTRYTHTIQKGMGWKRGGMEMTKSHIVMCLFLSTLSLFSLSQSPGDEIDGPHAIFPGNQV